MKSTFWNLQNFSCGQFAISFVQIQCVFHLFFGSNLLLCVIKSSISVIIFLSAWLAIFLEKCVNYMFVNIYFWVYQVLLCIFQCVLCVSLFITFLRDCSFYLYKYSPILGFLQRWAHINFSFWIWLTSPSTVFSRLIYVIGCIRILLFLRLNCMDLWHLVYPLICSIGENLDCLYLLAIVNNAALNIDICKYLSPCFQFWEYMLKNRIASSYGNSVFNFLRNQTMLFFTRAAPFYMLTSKALGF